MFYFWAFLNLFSNLIIKKGNERGKEKLRPPISNFQTPT